MIVATATVWDAIAAGFTFAGVLVNALLIRHNGRKLNTPSGDPIGHVVERTHDMAAVTVARVTQLNGAHANRGADPS